MNGNIEIKISGINTCTGQNNELVAEIAITHGFSHIDDTDSIGVNTIIGGQFKGKIDLVRAYGQATAQAIYNLAGDEPRIVEEFEKGYEEVSHKLAKEKMEKIRQEILEKSPFSREATERLLNAIDAASAGATETITETIMAEVYKCQQ